MANTFTPNYKLPLPSHNDNGWDTTLNGTIGAIDNIMYQTNQAVINGTVGPEGPEGPPSLFKNAFDNSVTYSKGDAVYDATVGGSYVSLVDNNKGSLPSSSPTLWGVQNIKGAAGTIGKPQATTMADYSNLNPTGAYSNTALIQGLTLFYGSGQAFGMDLGYNPGVGNAMTRMFIPDQRFFAVATYPTGTIPTDQTGFNGYPLIISKTQVRLLSDANGLNTPFIFNNDGSILINEKPLAQPLYGQANDTGQYFKVNPSGFLDGTHLSPGVDLFGSSLTFALDMGIDPFFGAVTRLSASDRGDRGIVLSMTPQNNRAATQSDFQAVFFINKTISHMFPVNGVGAHRWMPDGSYIGTGRQSASLYGASDGINPDDLTTIVQVSSLLASKSFQPSKYVMNHSGKVQYSLGDSLTEGRDYGAGDAAHSFPSVVATALGTTVTNLGQGTDEAADMSLKAWNIAPWNPSQTIFTTMIGSTEAGHQGLPYLSVSKAASLATRAWLATGSTCCVDLTNPVAGGGFWSQYKNFAGAVGMTSTTQNASMTYNVNTHGGPLLLWYVTTDYNGGLFHVEVDGAAMPSVPCYLSQAISTPNGATSFIQLLTIPVSAGQHSVLIKVDSQNNSGNVVTIMALGTPPAHAYGGSVLVVGGVIPFNTDTYRIQDAAYCLNAIDDVKVLRGMGLDVRFADTRAVIKASNTAIYDTPGSPHLTPAGYAAMAQQYITAFQATPPNEVNRATPPNSSSYGTPGDQWTDGYWNYFVNQSGKILRTAVSYSSW